MSFLLEWSQSNCLLLGNAPVLIDIANDLLQMGANVSALTPQNDETFLQLLESKNIHCLKRNDLALDAYQAIFMGSLTDYQALDQPLKQPFYIHGEANVSTLKWHMYTTYACSHFFFEKTSSEHGKVFLVGAGPGDPNLLTVKALRIMQMADVILYDRLVSQEIMALVNPRAELIYVGKQRQQHTLPQLEINQTLLKYARLGKTVLRLKGGDPFIFGRGGEEIELLHQHAINFEVIPGITAASGCAAYAGIPLTHRDYAQSVRFITGHTKNNRLELDWKSLLNPNETLVFYMGLVHLKDICMGLIDNGRESTTPAALVEKGTTDQQKVVVSTLAALADDVSQQQVTAPTLLIIGGVVNLHRKLHWFDEVTK